jgi:hypothetical protein
MSSYCTGSSYTDRSGVTSPGPSVQMAFMARLCHATPSSMICSISPEPAELLARLVVQKGLTRLAQYLLS